MAALVLSSLCGGAAAAAGDDPLAQLADDFWSWRAVAQPASGDDIPRIDRPAGWAPDWSAAAVAARRAKLAELEARWRALDLSGAPVPRQVDHRLIGTALARARWELEVAPGWRRNPLFYVEQTLGALFELLILPREHLRERGADLLARLDSVPATLAAARANLDDARAPFARLAIAALADVEAQVSTMARELAPVLDSASAARLPASARAATDALVAWRGWLAERLPALREETAVGREAYVFFLSEVALLPWGPERLVEMGRQEWERAVAFEALEANRRRDLRAAGAAGEPRGADRGDGARDGRGARVPRPRADPERPGVGALLSPGADAALARAARLARRRQRLHRPRPPRRGRPRLDRRAVARLRLLLPRLRHRPAHADRPREPWPLPADGPRWAHENPIRRHYYDSGANEGIAFYNEELMLQAGLFDDRPQTRATIYSFARLRALRVEVDVRLATGEISIEEAAALLRERVPMDEGTARDEAAFFASAPGQAITYQIGKLQILRNLATAKQRQGASFDLAAFHDFLWKNGNVPLALQRWELLGLADDLAAADGLR